MESVGRSYSRHFSAFLVDENQPPMPSQPVHQPQPSRVFTAARQRPAVVMRTTRTPSVDDIPVLEGASAAEAGFCSDDDDDEEDEDDDGDDDDDDDDDHGADDHGDLENVPVLQTAEEAGKPKKSKRKQAAGTLRKLRDAATPVRRSPEKAAINAAGGSPVVLDRKSSQLTTGSSSLSMNSSTLSMASVADAGVNGRSSMASNPTVNRVMVRSGWLVRQGQHLKTWKRRYFVLIKRTNLLTGEFTASLQYYKGSNFGKLRGEIHLHEGGPLTIRFVDVSESKKPFCFGISRGEFSLYCQGKDDEDVSAWVWHLQSLATPTPLDGTVVTGGSYTSGGGRGTLAGIGPAASLGNRGIFITAELRRLLHNSKSPEASKCKNFVKNFECQSASSLRQLRDLHASVTDSIVRIHGARIIAMTEEKAQIEQQSGYSNGGQPLKLSDLRRVTSRHVEDVVYSPVQEGIWAFLRRAFGEDDATLNRKLRWLQGKDQTYYNIPLHQASWKDWRKASKMLSQAALVASPTAKYEILEATVKEIQLTYAEEHDQLLEAENPLETDDLIPIFTYVLANSGLDNLLAMKLLLSELNGAWAVGGSLDNGAALSIFKYAVDFIGTVSIPAVLEDIFRDQITLSIDGEWRQVLELELEPTYRYGAVVRQISQHGLSTIGSSVARGHVLVTVNGQNVVLWPYTNIAALLKESSPPHRLAFIPSNSYFKILTSNKALWNVALAHACQRGDIASVQMLLANGADVNYVAHESGGNTPLHIAVSAVHFNVVSYILQHGAKPKALGESGRSALHMVGSPCTLPSQSPSASSTAAISGNSLRQSSMSKFQPTDKVVMIIKKLLNHGTPIETTDIFGYTPLMLLARKGLVNGVDVLVEHSGGDLDLNTRNWQQGMSALALAAREGHLDVVEALLDYGVQPDIANLRGDTPLHFAAAIAAKDICRALIQRDCDVDVRNRDGVTPLMMAAARTADLTRTTMKTGKPRTKQSATRVDELTVFETIEYFIEARADLYAVCNLYCLPLHYAARFGGKAVYKFIASKMKVDVDTLRRDLCGMTPSSMIDGKKDRSLTLENNDESPVGEENDTRESQIESQSDFQFLLSSSQQPNLQIERRDDLIVQVTSGCRLILAGSLAAICNELYRVDSYEIDDVAAIISTCTVSSYRILIDYMRGALQRTTNLPDEGVYVRRIVLHSVDLMVQSFMQKVELDTEVCSCIYEFCNELFPFKLEDDPACGQWLATSLLPMFAEAVRTGRLFDLRVSSPCEAAYSSLQAYLKIAKKANPTLRFLDDDLFASTFGVEVITESMRRRLSIAGVWRGEANKSFIVRSESRESPSVALTRKTLASVPLPLPRSRSGVADRVTRVWLLDVDVSVLADQITVFQHYLLSQIRVSEMLESKRSAEKTPAYDRLRQFHNHISVWVVNQILSRDDVDQRVQILSHFIKVAGVCLQPLQNFDGFMAIMNATNDSSVFRLKKTWNRLSPQVREQWHELKKYTESGARSLHKLMKDAIPPMIPYLGVVMQNIVTVQEYPDRVEGDLINFKKIRLLGDIVRRFSSLQSSPYLLQIDKRVLDQICSNLQFPDADACFNRSLKIEPRIPTS